MVSPFRNHINNVILICYNIFIIVYTVFHIILQSVSTWLFTNSDFQKAKISKNLNSRESLIRAKPVGMYIKILQFLIIFCIIGRKLETFCKIFGSYRLCSSQAWQHLSWTFFFVLKNSFFFSNNVVVFLLANISAQG